MQVYDPSLPTVMARLSIYGIVILANTAILLGWARYNQLRFGRRNRRRRSDTATASEIGQFYTLTADQVAACQSAKRNVMIHDERGHLVAFGPFLK